MSRDIKFRAWNLVAIPKRMMSHEDICFYKDLKMYELFCDTPENRPWIIMQWTGYNDKNGVGIYVEDFVNCNRYENQEDFIVKIKDIRQLPKEMFGSNLNWLEVVGNSFENGGRPKK